ncbi:unnamed protein product, partial [Iphiclides podalirius]
MQRAFGVGQQVNSAVKPLPGTPQNKILVEEGILMLGYQSPTTSSMVVGLCEGLVKANNELSNQNKEIVLQGGMWVRLMFSSGLKECEITMMMI